METRESERNDAFSLATQPPADPKAAALAYCARGFSVIPLKPRSKEPAAPIAPFLNGERRMTEAAIEAWWDAYPDHGVGIVTGEPSGITVVDVDPRNGGDLVAVRAECPTGMVAVTGGGGLHFFCQYVPSRCGKTPRPGVDRKSDGGYVVAAPSIHPDTGKQYAFEDFGDLGHAPAWVFEAPSPSATAPGQAGHWIADALRNPDEVSPGTQEETLTRLAYFLSGTMPQDAAHAILSSWADRLPLGNPSDPWTDEHVRSRLDRAYAKRALEPPNFDATCDGLDTVQAGGSSGGRRPKRELTPEDAVARVVGKCRSAQERAREELPETEWLVPTLVPKGVLIDLHGDPKAGKSTLVAHTVRAIVTGGDFLGAAVEPGRVIWFTEQPAPTFIPLLRDVGLHEHPDLLVLYGSEVAGVEWPERVAGLVQVAQDQRASLVVVDTFTKLAGIRGEDENKSGPILDALDALEVAKSAKLTVLLVRHDRKSGGDVISAGRGSNAVSGEADVIFHLTRDERRYGPNGRRLSYMGRLGDIPAERVLELTAGEYQVAGAARVQPRSAETLTRIVEVLPLFPAGALSGRAIAKLLKGQVGQQKVFDVLAEVRQQVEREANTDAEPGCIFFEGARGQERYYRTCECRVVPELAADGTILALRAEFTPGCPVASHGYEAGAGTVTVSHPTGFEDSRDSLSPGTSRPSLALPTPQEASRPPRVARAGVSRPSRNSGRRDAVTPADPSPRRTRKES